MGDPRWQQPRGPTVGNSRYKQVDRRGPALLLLHRGAVPARSKGCRERCGELFAGKPASTVWRGGGRRPLPYEYSDYNSSDEQSLTFNSYTIPEDDLELGQSRLLEVDNRAVLPAKSHIRFIVTSADVPHSWAVPSLGVKCDAVPGRLNQTSISVQREGVYYWI
ncbi:cytochrome c oxidase subunit 2-like [Solanum tuberosum]|uniref:cytochrome c oxidase subunit 2-like n=1 Tax=Solanum tuberosum TaxID=4113 RepID=UPI00073A1B8C|nr:PREDICTED: cytochrome c oxidase subunit 2-like [Solanum tuberosum]